MALRDFPALNASYTPGKTLRYERINVGVAIDALLGPEGIEKLSQQFMRAPQRITVAAPKADNKIDRLETDGLVQRVPHPTDGRTTLARLTSKGRDTAMAAVAVLNRDVFASPGLPADGVRATVEALAALRASAGDFALSPVLA